MKYLLLTSFVFLFLSGCSLFDEKTDLSSGDLAEIRSGGAISERGHTVDMLRPSSDVVGIVPGRRHTLGFPNKYSAHNAPRLNAQISALTPKNTLKPVSPKTLWDRYCTGEFISKTDDAFLETQKTPAKWIERCRPMK